ncbi:50S ribosomal protein L4 [Candidatus Nitrosopelagicus sp.]|nr:50S ribosomal protein L4 [Candidatus Nitrosopelagicus sp.]
MKVDTFSLDGKKNGQIELPNIFQTDVKKDVIHKAYINLETHGFQKHSTHATAGQDVVADSNDPPTGRGIARIARMKGGGGGRQGQAGEVASTRGGRQAHPPKAQKVIYKKINKKENKLALCSAISATKSRELILQRGHKIDKINSFPFIISDEIESITQTSKLIKILEDLNLIQDVKRLENRKRRSGKVVLRGRTKKTGKSVLFVLDNSKNVKKACHSIPGVDSCSVKDLSVLELAPGSDLIRLTVYSKKAIDEISKIKSRHLELMVTLN